MMDLSSHPFLAVDRQWGEFERANDAVVVVFSQLAVAVD